MGNAGGWLMNKPVGKGGQTTMLFDVLRRYPRAYAAQDACATGWVYCQGDV
jgi:hypothetical protein